MCSSDLQGFSDTSCALPVSGGLTATANPLVWTATFTPNTNIEDTATVTVTAGSYTDVAGNLGTAGSDTTLVDTQGPAAPTLAPVIVSDRQEIPDASNSYQGQTTAATGQGVQHSGTCYNAAGDVVECPR